MSIKALVNKKKNSPEQDQFLHDLKDKYDAYFGCLDNDDEEFIDDLLLAIYCLEERLDKLENAHVTA